ncbi:hypothetical protein TNCV_3874031 [Trichonephila clavipes]|nr:hypothetical protein TNCV_3874031 [Trichonephila clavipes]
MNSAYILRTYHRNHWQRRGPCILQSLIDLIKSFEETGSFCDRRRSGSPYVGYSENNYPKATSLGNTQISVPSPTRSDIGQENNQLWINIVNEYLIRQYADND